LRFPESAVLGDPVRGLLHGLGGETETVDAAVDFAVKQAGGFKDAEVFRDGRERHAERSGEFGDLSLAEREAGEDGSASGIGEGGEGVVETSGRRIFNHMV
jgi:hypothetical protein